MSILGVLATRETRPPGPERAHPPGSTPARLPDPTHAGSHGAAPAPYQVRRRSATPDLPSASTHQDGLAAVRAGQGVAPRKARHLQAARRVPSL